jgi:hypothetical protein
MPRTLRTSFPGQDKDEPIFAFVRPYPIAFIPTVLVFLVVFVFTMLFQYVLATDGLANLTRDVAGPAILALGLFQLLTLIVFMVAVFDFYYDIFIVTDRRLVDIDQEQIFYRRYAELLMENVEDVSSQVKGFLPTVFDYGSVEVLTAGAKPNFLVDNIRYHKEIASLILSLSSQAKRGVEDYKRWPEEGVIGIINNQPITSVEGLVSTGSLPADQAARANAAE